MIPGPHDSMRDLHLSEDDLAALADGMDRKEPDPRVQHLARCRSCMSAYADAVRYRAAWLARPEAFTSQRIPSPPSREWVSRRPLRSGWVLATASLVVAVGMFSVFLGGDDVRSRALPATIRPLIEEASGTGLVLPGGEAGAMPVSSSYRSNPELSSSSAQTVEDMRLRYEGGQRSSDRLFALADALIATRQIDLARDYVTEGLRDAPRDPRFLLLAGILADLDGAPGRAERLLLDAHRAAPHHPVIALDLGLVLLETRGADAAAPWLREVIARAPRTALAQRAQQALRASPSH